MNSFTLPPVIRNFPFDIIRMNGNDAVDFLHRITTNDYAGFTAGKCQNTLLITEKGRILDAVWTLHTDGNILMLTSRGMGSEILQWLNRYIIMEEIELSDVTHEYSINLHFQTSGRHFRADYYGFPIEIEITEPAQFPNTLPDGFDAWRIEQGIPASKKELHPAFNPLELNLWSWISFTKGCYIGQEVIARLDTYQKIQKILSKVHSSSVVAERATLSDGSENECGIITSVVPTRQGSIGLAVIRKQYAQPGYQLSVAGIGDKVLIDTIFTQEGRGTVKHIS